MALKQRGYSGRYNSARSMHEYGILTGDFIRAHITNAMVLPFSHAKDALSMLCERKVSFDLVISDVYMPEMDGFKLLEHVGLEMDLPVISKFNTTYRCSECNERHFYSHMIKTLVINMECVVQ